MRLGKVPMKSRLMDQEQSKQGMRKVAAQEFDDINGLRHFYSTVLHVIFLFE